MMDTVYCIVCIHGVCDSLCVMPFFMVNVLSLFMVNVFVLTPHGISVPAGHDPHL